jgi:hypothetical protein
LRERADCSGNPLDLVVAEFGVHGQAHHLPAQLFRVVERNWPIGKSVVRRISMDGLRVMNQRPDSLALKVGAELGSAFGNDNIEMEDMATVG